MNSLLINLQEGVSAKITELQGGHGFKNQLRSMGLLEGKTISIVTYHPFKGPIVIRVEGKMITLGRGFASRIMVEIAD